jgi:hypothetical protein
MKYSFKWRSKAFQVFDPDSPISKDDFEAKDLDDAWKIFFEKHLIGKPDQMKNLNVISITQIKESEEI